MVRALVSRIVVTAFLLFFGASTLGACKGQCRQLSEKLCQCATNSIQRDNCLRQASTSESAYSPDAAEEARCAELLPGCDCNLIDTPQGKAACGLSR